MSIIVRRNDNKFFKMGLNGLLILFGIAWAAIEFFWRLPFTFGEKGGIYWFLYYFEKLSSPLATSAFTMTLILVVVAFAMRATKQVQYSNVAQTAGALFLASLLFGMAAFTLFETETRHLDTLKIQDQLYYLTAYSAFDTNYALYRCDSVGVFCRQMYRSTDYMPRWFHASLIYYATTSELAIEVKDQGEIYRKKIP